MVVTSPAKIILFGEHAIVYPGHKAVVAALGFSVRAACLKSAQPGFRGTFKAPGVTSKGAFTLTEAEAAFRQAQLLHEQYKKTLDITPLKTFLMQDQGFYKVIAGRLAQECELPAGVDLDVTTNIPLGAGLGSSAAIAAAVIATVSACSGPQLSIAQLYAITKEIEDLQHGTASGVDPACVISGGVLAFEHLPSGKREFRQFRPKTGWDKDLHLIFSGAPRESTGEMVSGVRELYQREPAKYAPVLKGISLQAERFISGEFQDLGGLINENGKLLEELKLVSPDVVEFSELIRAEGGAVKVCGGGGRSASGMLLCKYQDGQKLTRLLRKFKFKELPVALGVPGINYHE